MNSLWRSLFHKLQSRVAHVLFSYQCFGVCFGQDFLWKARWPHRVTPATRPLRAATAGRGMRWKTCASNGSDTTSKLERVFNLLGRFRQCVSFLQRSSLRRCSCAPDGGPADCARPFSLRRRWHNWWARKIKENPTRCMPRGFALAIWTKCGRAKRRKTPTF